jgi:hypothetical protein
MTVSRATLRAPSAALYKSLQTISKETLRGSIPAASTSKAKKLGELRPTPAPAPTSRSREPTPGARGSDRDPGDVPLSKPKHAASECGQALSDAP